MMASTTRRSPRISGLAPIAWIALALYLVFLLYPLGQAFFNSFTNVSPLSPTSDFVGLDNYLAMLKDPRLHASLWFTLIVAVIVTVAANVVGLALAMLYNRATANYRVMRTLIFIPQVLSGVIIAFIWRSLLTQNGMLNTVLLKLGIIDEPVSWIGSPGLAAMAVCIVVSWVTIAFATVVYTASLQGIPAELYEAARVDGANAVSRFWHVTLPMIAPGTTISVVLCLITSFKLYDIIAVLTGGGPADSTVTTAFYLIRIAFTDNRFGYGSAIAMFLLLLTAVVGFGLTAILRRREVNL
jgi:ABC-type sugar transport system permease subunit